MTRRIMLLFILVILHNLLLAQEPFSIIEDFGHIQAKADGIIEYEEELYVVGSCIPASDTTYRQDLLITKYNLNGELISDLVFDHHVSNGALNGITDRAISIWKGDLLISHNIHSSIHDAITKVDTDLSVANFIDTFSIGEEIGIGATSHVLLNEERLVFPLGNNLKHNNLGLYDLQESKFSYFDFTSEADLYTYPAVVLSHNNLVYFISGVQYEDAQFNWVRDIKLLLLDKELKLKEEIYLNRGIGGANDRIHALINHRNELVISAEEKTGLTTRPTIYAVDLSDYSIKWQELQGDTTFKRRFDFPRSLIMTHDNIGYITVGYKYTDPERGGANLALITKMDAVGKTLWQKSISDLHEGSELSFDDVVATSDGYYVACGYRGDVTENDGYDSRTQMFMIKFDEEGNIVNRNETNKVKEKSAPKSDIKIYPNPTSGFLYIENLNTQSLSYKLLDQQGRSVTELKQEVRAELAILDLSGYPAGVYVLMGRNSKRELVFSEQVVLN